MRRLLLLVVLVVLVGLVVPTVSAVSYGANGQVDLTMVSQNPDPVEPGQVVTVKFKIENDGAETDEVAIVRIDPQFPFSIYQDTVEKNVGKLKAGSTGADAEEVRFKLKVDPSAVEEETELEVYIDIGDGGVAYVDNQFVLDIKTHDAILEITEILVTPEHIAPGETATVDIMVKNLADSLLKDIKFKLNLQDGNLPLAPYQSSSERRIDQLETNFQNSLRFTLIADPSAVSGLYKVPLNITYNDEQGTNYHIEDVLAVSIGEAPKLRTYIKKSTVQQDNSEGTITLGIANAGTTDIKFLELTLLPSDDYQLVSPTNYYYIGDVDSDDTESEELAVFINNNVDVLHLPLQLKYDDANNQHFQQEFDLELELFSSSQLKKFGVVERSNAWVFIVLLLLAGGGYYYYRNYYKKKK